MSRKSYYAMKVSAKEKERALSHLRELAEKPQHRWIPIESLTLHAHGYLTDRQTKWLTQEFSRKPLEIKLTFDEVTLG